MRDDEFEWDDDKAKGNITKHGVSFESARLVFSDPGQVDKLDDTSGEGELRSILIGMAEGRLLTVIYAERMGRYRIISARKANRHEQHEYIIENAV